MQSLRPLILILLGTLSILMVVFLPFVLTIAMTITQVLLIPYLAFVILKLIYDTIRDKTTPKPQPPAKLPEQETRQFSQDFLTI